MLKKITHSVLILCLMLVLASPAQAQKNPISGLFGQSSEDPSEYSIFGQTQHYYDLQDQLGTKELELEIFKNALSDKETQIAQATDDLQRLQVERASLANQITELEGDEAPNTEQLQDLNLRLQNLDQNISNASDTLQDLQGDDAPSSDSDKVAQMEQLETELAELEGQLEASQLKIKNSLQGFAKK